MKNPVLAAGGRWVRATHTEVLSEYPEWTRPYHLEMPLLTEDLSGLLHYPLKQELAFCLPVSFAEQDTRGLIRFEGYCKAALFLARQMAHHWDVRDEGVPIFIGVSENGMDIFMQYAELCNLPQDVIVPLPSFREKHGGWHCKFDLLGAPQLRDFERRIHFDVSAWLRPKSEVNPVCRALKDAWSEEPFLVTLPGISMSSDKFPWTFPVLNYTYDGFHDALASLLGTDVDDEHRHWRTNGAQFLQGFIFGMSRQLWESSEFSTLLGRLRGIVNSDEVILAVLARELGWLANQGVCDAHERFFKEIEYVPSFRHDSPEGEPTSYMKRWRRVHDYDFSV